MTRPQLHCNIQLLKITTDISFLPRQVKFYVKYNKHSDNEMTNTSSWRWQWQNIKQWI